MEAGLVIIPLVAAGASLLTLISGFGLGTLLLPVFALFFPLEVAILLTGLVHLLNNLFKVFLLGRQADVRAVLLFGVPAIVGAFGGAWVMGWLGRGAPLYQGVLHPVEPLDIVIASLMALFGVLELWERFNRLSLPRRWMSIGGLASGFLGGLSGHQGALRSIFLLRAGLTKEVFVATGVIIACLVDLTRIPIYFASGARSVLQEQWPLLTLTAAAAFAGALLGKSMVAKITMRSVQIIVGTLMVMVSLMLAAGLI